MRLKMLATRTAHAVFGASRVGGPSNCRPLNRGSGNVGETTRRPTRNSPPVSPSLPLSRPHCPRARSLVPRHFQVHHLVVPRPSRLLHSASCTTLSPDRRRSKMSTIEVVGSASSARANEQGLFQCGSCKRNYHRLDHLARHVRSRKLRSKVLLWLVVGETLTRLVARYQLQAASLLRLWQVILTDVGGPRDCTMTPRSWRLFICNADQTP